MKKGFTLIELLAVIVILAIIALIATPIILGIINDARKESNERSAELYASAVKNAMASYQLTHPNAPTSFDDLEVEYDGEVECETEELYKDGSFYITDCTANGIEVDYKYGRKKYEPQYYWLNHTNLSLGVNLPEEAKATVLELNPSRPFYIGLDVDSNNKITMSYVCFVRNEKEYCLKGTTDGSAYDSNVEIIKDAYSDVAETDACSFEYGLFGCRIDDESPQFVTANPNGGVSAEVGNNWCTAGKNGIGCYIQ